MTARSSSLSALVRIPFDVHDNKLLVLYQDPGTGVEELRVYALPR